MVCSGACHAAPRNPAILVLGDSLSAAYGMESASGWVSLLEKRLAARGYTHTVANASISGDTTSGGLTRLDRALATHNPGIVIVELGGNDGLRGLPLIALRRNLAAIIEKSQDFGTDVLLLGMRLPPNYGPAYSKRFHKIYVDLAAEYDLALVPFFLEGVAQNSAWMQADGVHPTAQGQARILDNVWDKLEAMLDPVT